MVRPHLNGILSLLNLIYTHLLARTMSTIFWDFSSVFKTICLAQLGEKLKKMQVGVPLLSAEANCVPTAWGSAPLRWRQSPFVFTLYITDFKSDKHNYPNLSVIKSIVLVVGGPRQPLFHLGVSVDIEDNESPLLC